MCSKAQIVEVENEENLMGLWGDIYPQKKYDTAALFFKDLILRNGFFNLIFFLWLFWYLCTQ